MKQPAHLIWRESDQQLSLQFRTNFRLDKDEAFLSTGIMSVVFTFLTVITSGGYLASDVPLAIALGFGLVTLFLYYLLALIIYNSSHIDVDEEGIEVSRKPIPAFWNQPRYISLSGVKRIHYAETPTSIRESYDTPRYNVWAEMVDGSRKVVVSDIVDDYAVFIAQRINEYLDLDRHPDVSRLSDDDQDIDEDQLPDALISQSAVDNR